MKTYFLIAIAVPMLALLSCKSHSENAAKNTLNTIAFSDTAITRLPNNQVCMVNNRFLNSEQIAVPLADKTYYGCCEGCVKMLKEDSTSHFTYDPLSGEQVDKAIAFIIGQPGTKEQVLYFKSEANAREYFDRNLKRKS
jgi:YHS domain-containing protein